MSGLVVEAKRESDKHTTKSISVIQLVELILFTSRYCHDNGTSDRTNNIKLGRGSMISVRIRCSLVRWFCKAKISTYLFLKICGTSSIIGPRKPRGQSNLHLKVYAFNIVNYMAGCSHPYHPGRLSLYDSSSVVCCSCQRIKQNFPSGACMLAISLDCLTGF